MQRAAELHARNKTQAEAHVAEFKADAQKAQADLKAKVDDLSKAGQASWAAMSQALDDLRNAFSKAIELPQEVRRSGHGLAPGAFRSRKELSVQGH